MKVMWTFPGKLGDAFLQWPVAKCWANEREQKITVGLAKQIAALEPVFRLQPEVEDVVLLDGIHSFHMGGQPFDFDFSKKDYEPWDEVYHAGFANFPTYQITQFVRDQMGLRIPAALLESARIELGPREPQGYLAIHATPKSNNGELPRVKPLLRACRHGIAKRFSAVWSVGVREDWASTDDWIDSTPFDDGGDWVKLGRFLLGANLVIACGSSMAAYAGALGVPCVRVHDTIGNNLNPAIWSNLGPDQYNFTSLRLQPLMEVIQKYAEPRNAGGPADGGEPQDLVPSGLGSRSGAHDAGAVHGDRPAGEGVAAGQPEQGA